MRIGALVGECVVCVFVLMCEATHPNALMGGGTLGLLSAPHNHKTERHAPSTLAIIHTQPQKKAFSNSLPLDVYSQRLTA